MKRKNVTRNALFTSIISLLLCVSMLVGTTFAWFTDEVTSGVNTITAGNLDVELYHDKANVFANLEKSKVDENTLLFTDVDGNVIEHWEPGVVAFTNLKVANVGSLALKYQLSVNSTETNYVEVDGVQYTLADALQIAVVPEGVTGTREEVIAAVDEWEPMKSFTLPGVLEGETTSQTYGIVVYWQPVDNADDNIFNLNNGKKTNDEKPLTITLGVNLLATQEMYEDDSFGFDYDAPANLPVVNNVAELQGAMNEGKSVKLGDNITVDGPLVIPEGNTVTLDLNGMDLSTTDPATGYAINNLGTLILMDSQAGASTFNSRSITARGIYNGYDPAGNHVTTAKLTILSGEYNAMGTNGGAAVYNYGIVEIKGGAFTSNGGYALNNQKTGKMTVSNASVTGGIYNLGELTVNNSKVYQHLSGKHAIYNYAAKLEINGGVFDSESGNELILADGQNSSVVINGGTFDKTAKSWLFGATTGKDISFVINGGVFNGYVNMPENTVDTIRPYGDPIVVTGGTFNFDPTNWVADGYKAVESSGAWTVVPENAIATSNDLIAAINAAADGDTLLLAPGEYELAFTNDTTFNVDNLIIEGMGNTKLAITSTEVEYGRIQGNKVTFKNITFTSNSKGNAVGATGEATYTNCTFECAKVECASGGKNLTYFNNCEINGTLHTSVDFSSGNTYVTDSKVAKAEYSGAATMYFTKCEIGELISWNMNTVLENCDVANIDMQYMTDGDIITVTAADGLAYATSAADPSAKILYDVPADYAEKELVVPEGVTALGNYAFTDNKNVETVTLPSTIKDLGRGFDSNTSVKKVVLNKGLETIAPRAFKATTALKEVVISSTVKTIDDDAFQKTGLKNITIPASVDYIGVQAFGASQIENVTIEGNVTINNKAFRGCAALKTVYFNGGDVTFENTTGEANCWFCHKESSNPNTSDITFHVMNETVAAKVKAAMGKDIEMVEIYIDGVLYKG